MGLRFHRRVSLFPGAHRVASAGEATMSAAMINVGLMRGRPILDSKQNG
jgi:hypothetical protein